MKENLTPLTKQYNQIKAKYPDSILLFRLGDFFETFNDDAVISSKVCGLTLTKRNNGAAGSMPLAGFPFHQLDNYLPKLVKAGYRVAVCDQLEDPKFARGIVKRGVTEVITPGIAISDKLLETKENNFILSLFYINKKQYVSYGLAFADASTGEFLSGEVSSNVIIDVLENLAPKEILIAKTQKEILLPIIEKLKIKPAITKLEDWFFEKTFSLETLLKHFHTQSLKGFGIEEFNEGIIAAGSLLHYIKETQQGQSEQIQNIAVYNPNDFILLDHTTRKNLEILFSIDETQQGNTLLKVLDKTITPMGGRLLKRWLIQPLLNVEKINRRLEIVDDLFHNDDLREKIKENITGIGDLERLMSKVSFGKANPRDYVNLKNSLKLTSKLKTFINIVTSENLKNIFNELIQLDEFTEELERAFLDEPSVNIGIGRIFRSNYNNELDEYVQLKYSGKEWVSNFQERERLRTNIQSLKVGYNSVFGYYIEVSKANTNKVPADYERRQTLTNAERYITPELKEFEIKILQTEDALLKIEQDLMEKIRNITISKINEIQQNSQLIAQLDCYLNFATVAIENNYVRPEIDDSDVIEIIEGRHPVIEKSLKIGQTYTSNSTMMNGEEELIHIITGPNMSGKSSYLRQVGLIALLGQIGSFVPAKRAKFGYVDKIFTRVGASDNIIGGESTFMVEMQEAANILNNATKRSLILLDEVGRGTATSDGISIAWAIAEYIHNNIKAKTIFATHYHELQELENIYQKIKNYQIEVIETGKDVIFTHKLARGGSDNSFGIYVAKLAGMPKELTDRAEEILSSISVPDVHTDNNEEFKIIKANTKSISSKKRIPEQLSIFEFRDDELRQKLRSINPEKLSPLDALQILYELKKITIV
jgi:DNA mismatch repair protein MutS